MFEQDLEINLVGILDAEVTLPVYGIMTPSESRDGNCVLIKTSFGKPRSINNPICDVDMEILILVQKSEDRDTDTITGVAAVVGPLLKGWAGDLDTACEALTVDTFRVDGYRYQGGGRIEFDDANQVWFCAFNLTLSGVEISA